VSVKSAQFEGTAIKSPGMVEVERSAEHVELSLIIPEGLIYFRGHFPKFAILPGVVQLDWAIQYGMKYFALGQVFPGTIRIKFRKPIRPDQRVTLKLKHLRPRDVVQFDYSNAEGTCSSGQIGFAPG
jgi:3-hydroxymyristoyl/3-hydroxydecanoyl-(acyl carrier protein) dehydratase